MYVNGTPVLNSGPFGSPDSGRRITPRRGSEQAHGGNISALFRRFGLEPRDVIDFSVNINPFGPPTAVTAYLENAAGDPTAYPEPQGEKLLRAVSGHHAVDEESIILGAGAAELLYWLTAFLKPTRVVVCEPSFGDYSAAALANNARVTAVTLGAESGFALDWEALGQAVAGADMLVLGHPNNPTGQVLDTDALIRLALANPRVNVVVDEAFVDFTGNRGASLIRRAAELPNLICLRSMTKIYAIPNLRLGYLVGHPDRMSLWRRARPPWALGDTQIEAGFLALSDIDYLEKTIEETVAVRRELYGELAKFGWLEPLESESNYFLVKIMPPDLNDNDLLERMLGLGIAIRSCRSFKVLGHRYFRVAVRGREDNKRLLEALRDIERNL